MLTNVFNSTSYISEVQLQNNGINCKPIQPILDKGRHHQVAPIHTKGAGACILLRDYLKRETQLHFQANSFEKYQLTL